MNLKFAFYPIFRWCLYSGGAYIRDFMVFSDAFKFRTHQILDDFNFGQNFVRNLKRSKFLVINVCSKNLANRQFSFTLVQERSRAAPETARTLKIFS